MTLQSDFGWHHDFPKLVKKLGFKFLTDKPKVVLDWNAIALLNINSVVVNQDVVTLENHINDVLYYSLHGEEIEILDSKFVKLFRIAQLTIEYLLFCLRYVDQGFIQLQAKKCETIEENESLRNELIRKGKTLNKYKKKLTEFQNVCAQHPPTMVEEPAVVFQCGECDKQFISAVYLNAHRLRRHTPSKDSKIRPVSPVVEVRNNETEKLYLEIKQLKERLNTTERILCKVNARKNEIVSPGNISGQSDDTNTFQEEIKTLEFDKSKETNDDLSESIRYKSNRFDSVSKTLPKVEHSVQCNLIKQNEDENQMEFIKNELKKWKDEETTQFLHQLEVLKRKIYTDFESLRPPIEQTTKTCECVAKTCANSCKTNQPETTMNMEALEHKLDINVGRLQSELAHQERMWSLKLQELEWKSRQNKDHKSILCIQHNSPVEINHDDITNYRTPIYSTFRDQPTSDKINTETNVGRSDVQNPFIKRQSVFDNPTIHVLTQTGETSVSTSPGNHGDLKYGISEENVSLHKTNNAKLQKHTNKTIFTKKVANKESHTTLDTTGQRTQEADVQFSEKAGDVLVKESQSTLERRSLTSLTDAVNNDPNFLIEFRKTMLEVMRTQLKQLGVDPEWEMIPPVTLHNHMKALHNAQKCIAKTHPTYQQLRNDILSKVDKAITESQINCEVTEQPALTQKPQTGYPPFTVVHSSPSHRQHQVAEMLQRNLSKDFLESKSPHRHSRRSRSPEFIDHSIPNSSRNIRHQIKHGSSPEKYQKMYPKWALENTRKEPEKSPELNIPIFSDFNATVQKMKDKVLSAFRSTEPTPKTYRRHKLKLPGDNRLQQNENIHPNVTEGIYKLTVIDGAKNPIPVKRSILNIQQLKHKKPNMTEIIKTAHEDAKSKRPGTTLRNTKEMIGRHTPHDLDSVEKNNENIAERPLELQSCMETADNLNKGILNPPEVKPRSIISKIPRPVSPQKQESVVCKPTTSPMKTIASYSGGKASLKIGEHKTSPKPHIYPQVTSTPPVDSSSTSSSEFESEEDIHITSVNRGLLKSTGSTGSLVKKKVLFDLIAKQKSSSGSYSHSSNQSLPKELMNQRNDSTGNFEPRRGTVPSSTPKKTSPKMNNSTKIEEYIDNGETTSISSSVFDGSKNCVWESQENKENRSVSPKTAPSKPLDDLVLSDFDFSS